MQQVLFWIPIKLSFAPNGIPIYGFGTMLFLSFIAAIWVAVRRSRREGVDPERLFDLAPWIFVAGILGARIVFMIHFKVPWQNFIKFWEGGIEFYGSAVGGWIGYLLARWLWFHKHQISTWQLADIVAPAVCAGLLIGRIGCLLNGCCYGHTCPSGGLKYPLLTAPAKELVVGSGYQTSVGFGLDEAAVQFDGPPIVGAIEPGSPAALAGLKRGDLILEVDGAGVGQVSKLQHRLLDWPRGQKSIRLAVSRSEGGPAERLEIPPFTPRSVPLHPTQVYEAISMALLFLVLMAFLPYRRHYGQAFVVLMIVYAIHRFFNETLRNDTAPILWNMTLSQVGSIGVFSGGVGLELYLRRFSPKIGDVSTAQPPDANPQ